MHHFTRSEWAIGLRTATIGLLATVAQLAVLLAPVGHALTQ